MSVEPFVDTLKEWIEISMHRSMRNFLQYARKNGLSMSHIGALFHLHRMGRCGVTELGEHLDVTSAAASQMLDRLVQQDLILRTEDPEDRRVKQIVLTEEGNRILEEGIRARQRWLEDLAQTLSEDEKKTVSASLNILINKISYLQQDIESEDFHPYQEHP